MNRPLSRLWLPVFSKVAPKGQLKKRTLTLLVTLGLLLALLPLNTSAQVEPPAVISLERQTPSNPITNADALTFRVTFSKPVSRVDASDFALSGSGAAGGSVTQVTAVSASVYDVYVSGITNNNGTVNLDVKGVGEAPGSNNIIDQEYTDEALNANLTGIANAYTVYHIFGQSFTPTESGLLTRASFFATSSTSMASFTMKLLEGDGMSGAVLASQIVTITAGEVQAAFSAPPNVIAGNKYTLEISGNNFRASFGLMQSRL